jgi:hypothetical protein
MRTVVPLGVHVAVTRTAGPDTTAVRSVYLSNRLYARPAPFPVKRNFARNPVFS